MSDDNAAKLVKDKKLEESSKNQNTRTLVAVPDIETKVLEEEICEEEVQGTESTNSNMEGSDNATQFETQTISKGVEAYKQATTWVLNAAPQSPSDVWLLLKEANKYLKIQSRGANTRKSLLNQLLELGVYELHIPTEQYRYFLEQAEQFMQSNFASEKIAEYYSEGKNYNLILPKTIAYPFHIQKVLKELKLIGDDMGLSEIPLPEYPKDIDLVEHLYNDIDLYSATTEEIEVENREELSKLEAENGDLKHQLGQYQEKMQELKEHVTKKESETKKINDELYKVQTEMGKISEDYQEIMRKYRTAKGELDDYLSGQKDVKDVFQKKIDNLEAKIQDIRKETQDFKLKYVRELEKAKGLEKELNQAKTTLNKTAMALKRITNKK